MNALVRIWQALFGIAESLTKTKELLDATNARLEQSLGLAEPPLKFVAGDVAEPPAKKGKNAA